MTPFSITRWAALCTVSAATIATVLLPPEAIERRPSTRPVAAAGPLESEYRRVRSEATEANDRMMRLIWLERMKARSGSRLASGETVTVLVPAAVDPGVSLAFERTIEGAVEQLAPDGPKVRIGFLLADRTQDGHPALAGRGLYGTEYYVGQDDAGPYCFVFRVGAGTRAGSWVEARGDDRAEVERILGPCGFYAAFGRPGKAVQEWLERGGHRLAVPVQAAAAPARRALGARGAFGLSTERTASLSLQACVAGSDAVCERLFTRPGTDPWSEGQGRRVLSAPVASFTARGSSPVFEALLAWAHDDFGDEAFATFWSSGAPVEDAFEAAFSVPLPQWVRTQVERHTGATRSRPTASLADLGGMLSFVVLLVAALLGPAHARERSA